MAEARDFLGKRRKKITIQCRRCKVKKGRAAFTENQAKRADKGKKATCKECGGR